MHIEFSYARGPRYFRALLRSGARRALRRTMAVGLVVATMGALLVAGYAAEGFGAIAGVLALVVGLMAAVKTVPDYRAAIAMPLAAQAPRRYVITEDSLESSTDLTSSRWSWPAVVRVDERPEAFVLWQEARVMFDVPREPLTPDQEAELRAHFVERGIPVGKAR